MDVTAHLETAPATFEAGTEISDLGRRQAW